MAVKCGGQVWRPSASKAAREAEARRNHGGYVLGYLRVIRIVIHVVGHVMEIRNPPV